MGKEPGRAMMFAVLLLLNVIAVNATTSLEVPAVDAEGRGILSRISVTAEGGSGDIFVSIFPLTGIDTQHSEKTAVAIAAEEAGVNATNFNMLFKIESSAEVVDGPSAGAALTLLSYAELSGKRMRKDVSITGSIDPDGGVGKVGGVFEKAKAVGESGLFEYKVFIVPRGQRMQSGVDLNKYAQEKWQMQVVEVESVADAIEYAFNTPEGEFVEAKDLSLPPLNLIPFKPTSDSGAFREIAAGEVQEARKRLLQAKASEGVRASLEETLNLSDELLAKNYYYSGANTAFLASLTLDELSLVNGSRRELREKLRELKLLSENLNFSRQTERNLEWVVGAKLRHFWAADRLSDAEEKIAIGNYISASGDLALAGSWLRAAYRMNSIAAASAEGRELKNAYYRDAASKIIDEAKGLEEDGALDGEALDHLATAISEFEDAEYLTAIFDATFAVAYSEALDEVLDASFSEIAKQVCGTDSFGVSCDVFKDRQFASLWEELYYAHASYSFQEGNRSRDLPTLINGVKLLKLSEGFGERKAEALAILANPPAPSSQVPASTIPPQAGEREVRVEVVAVPEDSMRNLIAYSIAGIILLIALYAYATRRAPSGAGPLPGGRSRAEQAEALFLKGRMSEKSFEYFREKYGGERAGKSGSRKNKK